MPAASYNHSGGNNGGLNIALSRPKSTSTGSSYGDSSSSMDMTAAAESGSTMILRPQCLFDEGQSLRRFN